MAKYKYIEHLKNKQQELHQRKKELEHSIHYNSSTIGDAIVADGITYAKEIIWKKIVKGVKDHFSKKD